MPGPAVEVCFSPALLNAIPRRDRVNVVVVDILRATTVMCTAFGYGVHSLIPVDGEKQALKLKNKGWLVAGEKDGIRLNFADFGNSPLEFCNETIRGKNIVYSTTNGTKAIKLASGYGDVYIASFVNIEAIGQWLGNEQKDILILCAGWKNEFSLEDALFAGALAEKLICDHGFSCECDSAIVAIEIWKMSRADMLTFVSKSSHYKRLISIEPSVGLKYCFFPEKFNVIPKLGEDGITDIAVDNL